MAKYDDLVERLTTATTEAPQCIIVYDEHVSKVLYEMNDTALPTIDRDDSNFEKALIRNHLNSEALFEDSDELPVSQTYHTKRFLAVQFPLCDYMGVLLVFDSDADPSLQRLHTQIFEWQQDHHPSMGDQTNVLGLVPLFSGSGQTLSTLMTNCYFGFLQCSHACGCCLPV